MPASVASTRKRVSSRRKRSTSFARVHSVPARRPRRVPIRCWWAHNQPVTVWRVSVGTSHMAERVNTWVLAAERVSW